MTLGKTPNQSSGFFAIRKGKGGLQRCIFLDWKDAEAFVDAEEDAAVPVEFHVFDTVDQAVVYLKETPSVSAEAPALSKEPVTAVGRDKTKEKEDASAQDTAITLASLQQKKALPVAPITTLEETQPKETNTVAVTPAGRTQPEPNKETEATNKSETDAAAVAKDAPRKTGPTAASQDNEKTAAKNRKEGPHVAASQSVPRPTTAAVQAPHAAAVAAAVPAPHPAAVAAAAVPMSYPPPPPGHPQSLAWMALMHQHQQHYWNQSCYRPVLPKGPSPPLRPLLPNDPPPPPPPPQDPPKQSQEKPKKKKKKKTAKQQPATKRRKTGLTQEEVTLLENEPDRERYHKPQKRWHDMRAQLQEYMDAHNGSCKIDRSDVQNKKLREWVETQQGAYRKFDRGQYSIMSEEKLALLKEMGFQFTHVPFERRIQQLKAYHAEHGNVLVPSSHKELGFWMKSLRKNATEFATTGEPVGDINEERLKQLKELGFEVANEEKEWEAYFEQLCKYKQEHGDCKVRKKEHRELYNWITRQRNAYQNLRQGKESKLSASRLLRLNELGLDFSVVRVFQKWGDQVEKMKAFKAEHGHLNIPVDHEELGEFSRRQRNEYQLRLEGRQSAMTDERIKILTEIGFELDRGQARGPKTGEAVPVKSWDERYQELLAFKEEFGHTNVPKASLHIPGLAAWVKRQRKNYTWMVEGRKGPMTADKALKLSTIGFDFDPTGITYQKWEGMVEKLKSFKAIHGHLNVPVDHEELGQFTRRQRSDYKRRLDGKSSPMSDERVKILTEIGFELNRESAAGKKLKNRPHIPVKSWDERYQELIAFKEAFGHTNVPKGSTHIQGLASWVKRQRKNYVSMTENRKSPMTPEKALKLSTIEFDFDPTGKQREKKTYTSTDVFEC